MSKSATYGSLTDIVIFFMWRPSTFSDLKKVLYSCTRVFESESIPGEIFASRIASFQRTQGGLVYTALVTAPANGRFVVNFACSKDCFASRMPRKVCVRQKMLLQSSKCNLISINFCGHFYSQDVNKRAKSAVCLEVLTSMLSKC